MRSKGVRGDLTQLKHHDVLLKLTTSAFPLDDAVISIDLSHLALVTKSVEVLCRFEVTNC